MRSVRFIFASTACLSGLVAVEPGKPSVTAVMVLQMRAVGTKIPKPELRNPDSLALRLFGAREREVLLEASQTVFADLDFGDAWNRMGERQRVFVHVLARTRAIDDTVRTALKGGANQVVILGAGYDSRAYRMQEEMKNAAVFEVDFPPTQELKKMRLREVALSVPKNVVFVPIDFTTEDLPRVLQKSGYRSNRKTVFVWEGVIVYLPKDAVDSTLHFVARNSAPGSEIVFDYESERVARGDHDDKLLAARMARLQRLGEPHIFGLPEGRLQAFLEQRGLMLSADFRPEELTRRYLTAKDGTRIGEEPWYDGVCVARVPYHKRPMH